jgi:hypothetical protein
MRVKLRLKVLLFDVFGVIVSAISRHGVAQKTFRQ